MQSEDQAVAAVEIEGTHHYNGIAQERFPQEAIDILMEEIDPEKVSILPNGPVYLTQNEYRRRLNRAFGPGGWALKATNVYADEENGVVVYSGTLYALGRYVSEAIGENRYKSGDGSFATSAEAAKSECLTRCCKDLGIASELWDKDYIEKWKSAYAVEVWCNNVKGEKSRKMWRLISDGPINQWPWEESGPVGGGRPAMKQYSPEPTEYASPAPPKESSLDTADDLANTLSPESPELLVLGFGKHKGKTLANVQDGDSSYFSWLCEKWSPKAREDGTFYPSDVDLKNALRAIVSMDNAGAPKNYAVEENDLPF